MVWLTDDLHHTVRKFTPEGKLLLTIGDPGPPAELQGGKPFNRPTHVAICPKSGYLFISDGYGNSRVHKYSPGRQARDSRGASPAPIPASSTCPTTCVTDRDGLVYVADRENHRVQIFDGKGGYQGQWNNLHRPCGLFADRGHGLFFVGELGSGDAGDREDAEPGAARQRARRQGPAGARASAASSRARSRASSSPPTAWWSTRAATSTSGEVSWTGYGQFLTPPRVMRSFQKFKRAD